MIFIVEIRSEGLIPYNKELYKIDKAMDIYRAYSRFYQIKKDEVLLDLGCRYGNILKFCSKKSCGTDINRHVVDVCKRRGFNVVLADATKGLPYDDKYFDVVFCKHVIEHVLDTPAFMKEAQRVLKNNGRIILITPNILKRKFKFFDDAEHVKPFTSRAIKQILWDNGFELEKISFEPKFIFPLKSLIKKLLGIKYFNFYYKINIILNKLGYGQRHHIYAIAIKIGGDEN